MTTPDKIETRVCDANEKRFFSSVSGIEEKYVASDIARQLEHQLTQWREVAGRLAEQLQACDRFIAGKQGEIIGLCAIKDSLTAYDALSKSLSDAGGKG